MKMREKILSCLAIAVIASGCSREIESPIKERGNMIERIYTISVGAKTKTSYSENKVFWEAGDKINYYSCDGRVPGSYIVLEKGEKTDITATIGENDDYFIAYYGNGVCRDNTSSSFAICDAIKAEQDGTFANAHISTVKTSDIGTKSLTFSNITSLVKFSLDRKDVKKMSFTSNDGTKICGNIQIVFDDHDKASARFIEEESTSNIIVNTAFGSGPFYIATLPTTLHKGFTCAFYDENDKKIGVIATEKELNINRNEIIDLGTLDTRILPDAEDLGKVEKANSYLVSKVGDFMFNAKCKGNSDEAVGDVSTVKVLWETNNTNYSPGKGGVIKDVEYSNGYIRFTSVANGNASIAALDSEGKILWSWHIWVCLDYDAYASGQDYVYKKNEGKEDEQTVVIGRFMDRNLGALSNVPGSNLACGLLYEWGRKDPFLGYNTTSTIVWLNEESSATNGTVEYATANPTTFLYSTSKANKRDWLVEHNDGLWGSDKTKYDPCPPGWRVPDNNVWALAFKSESTLYGDFDEVNKGMQFGGQLGPDASIWYPASGFRDPGQKGIIQNFGRYGFWWACNSGSDSESSIFKLYYTNDIMPVSTSFRSWGYSVRCVSTYIPPIPDPVPVEKIEINPTSLTLKRYHSQKLECKIYPDNADHKAVTWQSDNSKVAEVDQEGNVTACYEGTCRITVTSVDGPSAYCDIKVEPAENVDLSANGTANCYLVSTPGTYKFKATVKGNSSETIENGVSARLLWESFGNNMPPYAETILCDVDYADGYITFEVPSNMRDGNAVIALVDAGGKILWSWHIWAFRGYDIEKNAQKYFNNAVMMDCNLGAVSLERGNVQNIGLLYQWGRKDPFLASESISSKTQAASTLVWPAPVSSSTVEYSIANPTTFILGTNDWATSSDSQEDPNTRWAAVKAKYDPCPPGWRVPDGGASGVWSIGNKFYPNLALLDKGLWLNTSFGCDFTGVFGNDSIWYMASEYRNHNDGIIYGLGMYGEFWSITSKDNGKAYNLYFCLDYILLNNITAKAQGMAVRCMKENSYSGVPVTGLTISSDGSRYLAKKGDSIVLEARLTPDNASYQYIQWDNRSPECVSMAVEGKKVTVTRECDEDIEDPIYIQAVSLDGDRFDQCEIFCKSEE